MIAVDTNVLLRYLIWPQDARNAQWQVDAARKLIDLEDRIYISDIVIAELEWVLESVFGFTRQNVAQVIEALSSNYRFVFENWLLVRRALTDYQENAKVDFSDCLIAHQAKAAGATTLYTFEGVAKLGGLPHATSLANPNLK